MDFHKCRTKWLLVIYFVLSIYSEQIESVDNEDIDHLLAFFDKPQEPLVNPKVNRYFELPASYFDENYRKMLAAAPERDPNLPVVKVKELPSMPDLGDILSFDRNEQFSLYDYRDRDMAAKLIDTFIHIEDIKNLISLLTYLHHRINPYLFIYSLSVALMNRADTKGLKFPNIVQVFPERHLVKGNSFQQIVAPMEYMVPRDRDPVEILLQRTPSDFTIEQKMAYWREDIGANLHHWHWHLAYPHNGNLTVVEKDRRGELFYYMHHQVVARYNFERLCNGLNPVERYSHCNTPLQSDNVPKPYNLADDNSVDNNLVDNNLLDDNLLGNDLVNDNFENDQLLRRDDMPYVNVAIPSGNIEMDIANLIRFRKRICRAINSGYAVTVNGTKVELNNISGIDILGNMVESNRMSPNYEYYGDSHNFGHLLIADLLEPRNNNFEPSGVMREPATAMRDPIFYRWHSYTNGLFEKFKKKLRPYTVDELDYSGIKVIGANIKTDGDESDNVLNTFWSSTTINLKHGLNFLERRGNLLVKYNHLQHRNFTYKIVVENEHGAIKEGTCRIFLSPAVDEKWEPWDRFADQRHMFIELDKFKVELQPGTNIITRKSVSSTVTIPFQQTFYDVDKRPADNTDASQSFHYSGCGWPHHLLIPRGIDKGYPSELFVMITNYEEDEVEDSNLNKIGETYCGIRGSKYPDKKPMGFPFDRLPRDDEMHLKQFLTPNMFVQSCSIKHSNDIIESKDD